MANKYIAVIMLLLTGSIACAQSDTSFLNKAVSRLEQQPATEKCTFILQRIAWSLFKLNH